MESEYIYSSIADVDLGERTLELQEENAKLLKHVQRLEEDVEKLCQEILKMKKEKDALAKNISELFKTAKREIERKDGMIADLRRELDDILFRRNKNDRNCLNGAYERKKIIKEDSMNRSRSRSGSPSRTNPNSKPENKSKSPTHLEEKVRILQGASSRSDSLSKIKNKSPSRTQRKSSEYYRSKSKTPHRYKRRRSRSLDRQHSRSKRYRRSRSRSRYRSPRHRFRSRSRDRFHRSNRYQECDHNTDNIRDKSYRKLDKNKDKTDDGHRATSVESAMILLDSDPQLPEKSDIGKNSTNELAKYNEEISERNISIKLMTDLDLSSENDNEITSFSEKPKETDSFIDCKHNLKHLDANLDKKNSETEGENTLLVTKKEKTKDELKETHCLDVSVNESDKCEEIMNDGNKNSSLPKETVETDNAPKADESAGKKGFVSNNLDTNLNSSVEKISSDVQKTSGRRRRRCVVKIVD